MRESVKKAKQLIKRVYEFNSVGGNLHVQLDDGNVEDEYFKEFRDWFVAETPEQLLVERECFDYLKSITFDERCEALGLGKYDPYEV